jgi:predicted RNase H-like nuclease (RuvC/YqgF family)
MDPIKEKEQLEAKVKKLELDVVSLKSRLSGKEEEISGLQTKLDSRYKNLSKDIREQQIVEMVQWFSRPNVVLA